MVIVLAYLVQMGAGNASGAAAATNPTVPTTQAGQ